MKFKILTDNLLKEYSELVSKEPIELIDAVQKEELPVDYFEFYKSMSSVYSSKIEGEEIDFDSYFKHKFLHVKFKPDYTRKADDLFAAYDFIEENELNLKNVQRAHGILSKSLLPKSQQGFIRTNPMYVLNSEDRIEYVAASPSIVKEELDKFFHDVKALLLKELDSVEVFYYASLIHLVFVKIHPFQDGNGRTARLIEKWFLIAKLGKKATSVKLEKNYFQNLPDYYTKIKRLGLEYETLNYERALPFLLMTIAGLESQN